MKIFQGNVHNFEKVLYEILRPTSLSATALNMHESIDVPFFNRMSKQK